MSDTSGTTSIKIDSQAQITCWTADEMKILREILNSNDATIANLSAELAESVPKSKVNAMIDNNRVSDAVTIDSLSHEIVNLNATIKVLEAGEEWVRVPNGKYMDDCLMISKIAGIENIAIQATRDDGRKYWLGSSLPEGWQLCRRKEGDK